MWLGWARRRIGARRRHGRRRRNARGRSRGCRCSHRSAQPCGQLLQCVGDDVVVGPQALTLGVHDPGVAELLQVVGERGLGDVEQRHELAHADLAGVLAQHVHQLQPDRVTESLGDLSHPQRTLARHIRVDDGLATALAGRSLLLGGQLQIDGHLYIHINNNHSCQCNTIWVMNAGDESPAAQRPGESPIRYVLFVRNHNAGRSQMAQAFFERYGPENVRAESAGTEPAREVWPPVVEAMREVGVDITARKPKKLTVEMQLHADWAVTMGCGDACPYVATKVEAWDIPDPAGKALEEVRAIRDLVSGHVDGLVIERLAAIYADRTAHQMRLARLLPMLATEFAATRSPEAIRGRADAVLDRFDGARVRSHIMTLAHRQTRECLSHEEYDAPNVD